MAIGVGLRIGRVVSTAVIASNEPGTPDPVVLARDSVLHVDHDGNTSLGSVAHGDEARTIAGFLTRVGDASGITASDGRMYRAEDAMATAIHCLLRECHPLPTFGGMDRDSDPATPRPTRRTGIRTPSRHCARPWTTRICDTSTSCPTHRRPPPGTPPRYPRPQDSSWGSFISTTAARPSPSYVRACPPARLTAPPLRRSVPGGQLATALGSFGWMPDNLEAVVVMGDGLVARDRTHIQEIANSLATKLTVRSLVGPGPEQTAALGAGDPRGRVHPARETNKTRIGCRPPMTKPTSSPAVSRDCANSRSGVSRPRTSWTHAAPRRSPHPFPFSPPTPRRRAAAAATRERWSSGSSPFSC
ncbi:hypothetical protein NJ76_29830 [Rhodococcus sp. IITR03]|nr:hypothetical protein NJ76_29830 [Rhodococcus sp. IITR03]